MTQINSNPNIELPIHRFTVKEYYHLAEAGILHEDDNVELIDGRIIDMTPIGSKHASRVDSISNLLFEKLQKRAIIRVQNPIDLDEQSEPEPDVTILKKRTDFYSEHHPRPEDVLLIIEVADSSIEYDRTIKIPLYAKSGIQEVWLVNILENTVEIYHSPSQDGYKVMIKLHHTESITPTNFHDITIKIDEMLGIF